MWIKCSDKLPPMFEIVLITNGKILAVGYRGKYMWGIDGDENDFYYFESITHWMPLPPLPNKQIEKNVIV